MFLCEEYESGNGHRYYKGVRFCDRIVIVEKVGLYHTWTYIDSIEVYAFNGTRLELVQKRDYDKTFRNEEFIRQESETMVCNYMGMKVLAYDIYKIPELENENMKYVEMDELLANSDFISLHTPSIDGKPLINADTISRMKDGVVIINTSRGNNVDEKALLDALNSGKVYGAGLDVFAEEPPKNVELYSHPKVSCTPHIGASTNEAQKRIGAEIVDIIEKFFN